MNYRIFPKIPDCQISVLGFGLMRLPLLLNSEEIDKEICLNKGILSLFVSHSVKKSEAELVDLCIRFKRTDGVIIVNPLSDYTGDRIISMNISPHSAPDLSDAIKLLKNGGHTRISFIGSTSGNFNSVLFKNTLAE